MKKTIYILILFWVLVGCRAIPVQTHTDLEKTSKKADSVHVSEKESVRNINVPPSSVSLDLKIGQIESLPVGATYTDNQDQAKVTVKKVAENEYRITADCDSLNFLIAEKEREIYRYRQENNALKLNQLDIVEVYKQTKTQIVLCWFGRVFVALLIGAVIFLFFRFKKYLKII